MDARALGIAQGLARTLHIFFLAAGQGRNAWTANLARDKLHRGEVAVRGNGEAGFEHIDAQLVERLRHAQLFRDVHAASGRLLAVTQRGIEDRDSFHGVSLSGLSRPTIICNEPSKYNPSL